MILVVLLQHPKVPAVASTLWIDCVSSVLIKDLGGKETEFGLRVTPRLLACASLSGFLGITFCGTRNQDFGGPTTKILVSLTINPITTLCSKKSKVDYKIEKL